MFSDRTIETVQIMAVCLIVQRMLLLELVLIIIGFLLMVARKTYLSKQNLAVAATQTEGSDINDTELTKRIAREVLKEMSSNDINHSQFSTPFFTHWTQQHA